MRKYLWTVLALLVCLGTAPVWGATRQAAQSGASASQTAQQNIATQFQSHPSLSGVQVSVRHNVVTLNGTVATAKAKREAANLAAQSAAGMTVKNHITVSGNSGNSSAGGMQPQPPARL